MTSEDPKTITATIQRSFQDAVDKMQMYADMLPFFEAVYLLQESSARVTEPGSISLDPELLKAKQSGGFPLLDREHVSIDIPAAMQLFAAILAQADKANPKLMQAGQKLGECMQQNEKAIEEGLHLVLTDDVDGIERLGNQLGLEKEILAFFLYNSLLPSIEKHVSQLSDLLPEADGQANAVTCPVCASKPGLSFLSETGQRYLICGFCRHQWSVKRVLCAHCGNSSSESISYFYTEEEKAYRVNTCEGCKTYIKTVDVRELKRDFYPPLESIVTAHLDIRAQELGYHSDKPCWQLP